MYGKKCCNNCEMSSFQLEYSKFVRPNHAILINITRDHLDWHGSMKNYINSKFNFSLQIIKIMLIYHKTKI